jgi:hypothetical protein
VPDGVKLIGRQEIAIMKAIVDAQRPRFSKSFGTYMHEVSDFYTNHPQASRATIGMIPHSADERVMLLRDHVDFAIIAACFA